MRRYLLPDGNIQLFGESSMRSWAVNLTAVQAAAPARLLLRYRNAVVVAPEASRLQVLFNDVVVIDDRRNRPPISRHSISRFPTICCRPAATR
ncbi:cellulose biosynthesis cyclic di-GMP-binding regulatory protein BcsB [Neoaquamicrobium sediminum]|uniref:cellulose biosynthesis cyclic di-GMP-binding regulatory protein BcsB n=1 Tax=Neoaquamicrobium sediminum TaxID=1849104 RepID=UPI0015646B8B|nr:cellulose biosynthesis cyclic di-GMP-binding regulatory protein BcsB [Mesorhizobium sediminum]NRC54835.1 hypothetical protein [Mesorhizobium sediminum]